MFRTLQKLIASDSSEQIYLAERLQSAKWLGWDAQAQDGAQAGNPPAAAEAAADILLAMPVSGKPA